jgi:hypothetical protein
MNSNQLERLLKFRYPKNTSLKNWISLAGIGLVHAAISGAVLYNFGPISEPEPVCPSKDEVYSIVKNYSSLTFAEAAIKNGIAIDLIVRKESEYSWAQAIKDIEAPKYSDKPDVNIVFDSNFSNAKKYDIYFNKQSKTCRLLVTR